MVERKKCCGCSACKSVCPQKCIQLIPDKLGFFYPVIDKDSCINCGLCEKVCPALQEGYRSQKPKAWGGYSKNQDLRKSSSSGGIFSLLAEKVIKEGGVVFGAALSDDMRQVNHVRIEHKEELWRLRGSKYVQSDMRDIYSQVQRCLNNGIRVLFSGTPCQVEGLKLFLRKEYDNLLSVEIICHGVPSPKLYKKYIDFMEKRLGALIKRVFFRDENGGGTLIMRIETEDDKVYRKDKFNDPFFRFFLRNNCLRESCYSCPSRGLKKRADITLSDFWGVENVAPELIDNNGGISLVLTHTKKGEIAFDSIKNKCFGHEVGFEEAIKGNQAFFTSYERPKERTLVEEDIDDKSFVELYVKYGMTWKGRIKRRILLMFHRNII